VVEFHVYEKKQILFSVQKGSNCTVSFGKASQQALEKLAVMQIWQFYLWTFVNILHTATVVI